MYDAVTFFATSLHGLIATQAMKPTRISCDDITPWLHGYSLINYMRVVITPINTYHDDIPMINYHLPRYKIIYRWSWMD